MARVTVAEAPDRPFPPGEYPIVVVGSGPGALQTAYFLSRLGIEHAVISADTGPGGMFRRWPFFQRLLSWTKPYAAAERTSRAFERWDWNSLLALEPELRGIAADFMDGTSDFPSRPEMEQNLTAFAQRAGVAVRFGCRWESTRREETADGDRFVLTTSDGEYRCRYAIFAVGVAEPYSPSTPGIELAVHYADTRDAETYAGKRLFILGKQNSGLRAGVRPAPVGEPNLARPRRRRRPRSRPARWSAFGRATSSRSRTRRSAAASTSWPRASRASAGAASGALVVSLERSDNAMPMSVEADEVIAATGFTCPLRDLPALGVATFGQAKLPAQTEFWESATVPGIFFAGTITQGSAGLKKHGIPPNSGALHGYRYNARVLVREIGQRHFGIVPERPALDAREVRDHLLMEATFAPSCGTRRRSSRAWSASTPTMACATRASSRSRTSSIGMAPMASR